MSGTGHIVVAPDKFKGSLTAPEVAEHVARGLRRFRSDLEVWQAPVADGGDGTLDAVVARGFSLVPLVVTGPTGLPITASFARNRTTAVVELSEASGLRRLRDGRRDPMSSTSRGTGELIRAALDANCNQIVLGLGGSACTDGGAGMLQALGARLLDDQGNELAAGGRALRQLHSVDLAGIDARLAGVQIVLARDVDNPLLGPNGAAAVYGPQKGATADDVATLEAALERWSRALAEVTGADASTTPGAGAAGGVGFAALAVLGAEQRSGIELILELIGFDDLLPGARLVITGEGSLDLQSLHGKAPVGVAAAAARHGSPTIAVAGHSSLSALELDSGGLRAAYALTSVEPDSSVCIREAGRLLEQLAAEVLAPEWLSTDPAAGGQS